MKIYEITSSLTETTEELHDLKIIATLLVNAINGKEIPEPKHASDLVKRKDLGKITSETVLDMYSWLRIFNNKDDPHAKNSNGYAQSHELVGGGGALTIIWLNPTLDKTQMISTLTHELQHALDNWKGALHKKIPKYRYKQVSDWNDQDQEAYRTDPVEVNARFSQAADYISWRIAKVIEDGKGDNLLTDTNAIVRYLISVYKNQHIDRNSLVKGPRGDKAYRRLLTRGMMFYKYIVPLLKAEIKPKTKPPEGLLKRLVSTAIEKVKSALGK